NKYAELQRPRKWSYDLLLYNPQYVVREKYMTSFEHLKIIKPEPIQNRSDDLQKFWIKLFKHFFRITAPYFWGPKHTDVWSIGNFISKIAGKRILDAKCQDGNWLALPMPVYTSHFLDGPDHKRYNKDNIAPIIKQYAAPG